MQSLAIKPGTLVIRGVSHAALNWFFFALAVRITATLAIHLFSLNHGFGGFYPLASGHDDGFYFNSAADAARGVDLGVLPSFYPRALGFLFYLTGPDLLVGQMFNGLMGALSVGVGVLLARDLTREEAILDGKNEFETAASSERAGHIAGFALCFYPSLLWYSTQLVKDPILVFFGMWALLLAVRLLRRPQFFGAIWLLAALCGLFLFRTYAALCLIFAIMLFTLRFRRQWLGPIVLAAAIGPLLAGQGLFGWNQIQPWLDAERLESFREVVYSTGGSVANVQVDYSSALGFLTTYPLSFATAMFGPLPWQWRGGASLAAVPEVLVVWPLIPLWWRGLREIGRGRRGRAPGGYSALLLLFSVILIAAVALFSDNIGANTRLRLLPWCAFLVFAAVRLEAMPIWKRLSLKRFFALKTRKKLLISVPIQRTIQSKSDCRGN